MIKEDVDMNDEREEISMWMITAESVLHTFCEIMP
jgi:hypothetical protein